METSATFFETIDAETIAGYLRVNGRSYCHAGRDASDSRTAMVEIKG